MRSKVKQSIIAGNDSVNLLSGRDINLFFEGNIPTELVDQRVEKHLDKIRKSRFFREFDKIRSTLNLGRLLTEGNLAGCSDELRARGLAWCARLLSRSEKIEQAEKFLEVARSLGGFPEIRIAEAFLLSQKGDKAAALHALASIDSDASRSAGLMIVEYHDGAEAALKWMNDAGFTVEHLDSDGKSILLSKQLQMGYWDDASKTVCAFSECDFGQTPILYHLAAITKLVAAVHTDFRAVVLTQVPFEAQAFPLASDAVSIDARRAAHEYFLNAVEAAKQLACPRAARTDDEYALWLELRDPAQTIHGKNRLEAKLRDPDSALGFVRYAFQFGIQLDLNAVERDIDRNIAINGEMTLEAAIARFALAFKKPTHLDAANYIVRHHKQLAAYIDPELMLSRQIELFSRAGLVEKANEGLNQLIEQGIPVERKRTLRRIIAEAEGNDPVESCKTQYKSTGNLADLINLVGELDEHQQWEDLCEYGRRLFVETRSLRDAELLVMALSNTHSSEELVDFLKTNSDLLPQSRNLRMAYAWGLYNEGLLLESRSALAELRDDSRNANYRSLQINLAIAMGDWASLSDFVTNEYQERENRTAQDLMGAAQLSLDLGLPHARELVYEAAARADDDAALLATAYFVATKAGWEDNPEVFRWLERAAELSGDDGPIQKMSFEDILDRKPEWDRRTSETWRLLTLGQIPNFLAAQSLNRTLIDHMTFPALANLSESDPRHRNVIPAYSGKRMPLNFDVSNKTVALDATALLTLSFLNILDATLDAFKTTCIPHSTLSWLFEERQKASFHQPSRIANAHQIRDLLATDSLEKFTPSTVANSDLSDQVGDQLSILIAEAEKIREGDDTQHIVVRPAPVHRISSLMKEDADLSAHTAVLCSCLAVVDKLKQKAQITAKEEKRARVYLQIHEKQWPNQPVISDGAVLYLDDLAITNLLHLGLLGKIKAAGLRAVAAPREINEVDALISYERISDEVKEVINRIRTSLNSRIESGQVKVGSRQNFGENERDMIQDHPTVGIIALTRHCDATIVDDRFVNQHANIDQDGTRSPVLSTLDLLDSLATSSVISNDDWLEYRTRLRRAGYFFVSVNEDELNQCIRAASIVNKQVVETAELKAIRESLLSVRMRDWLQLPNEAPWLDGTHQTFIRVLRNLWGDGADIEEAMARSSWLAEQIDIRGWAHRIAKENADHVVRIGRGAYILMLLRPPESDQQDIVDAYLTWAEERILAPIKKPFPDLYDWIVEWYRRYVAVTAETDLSGGDDS
jgi:hypothetical protein